MDQTLSARTVLPLRILLLASLVAGLVYYVATSIHWPIVWDAAVMHYVTFLMDHGLKPYSEITDSNMPGSYIVETVGMHLFGRGDLAWRFFDLFLCGAITLASVEIARPVDWIAGVYGGLFFTLMHGVDGPRFGGERDLVITALLICGLAFLFRALRGNRALWMLPFGLTGSLAAAIKPTSVPVCVLLLLAATLLLRRRRQPVAPYVLWTLAGALVMALVVVGFLVRHHAFRDFFFVVRYLLPSYISLQQLGFARLTQLLFPNSVLLILALAALLAVLHRPWTAERRMILLCLLFGAFSYYSQRKGYPYHRYPLLAFLLLFVGMEILSGLRRSGLSRALAALAIAVSVFVTEPHLLRPLRTEGLIFPRNMLDQLSGDLGQIGIDQLQRNIQCFDITYGCFSALYHLGILQSNGFTGDLLFFSPTEGTAVNYYREMFWRLDAARPTQVLVISNQWFQKSNTFDKLAAWPAFDAYLKDRYTLVVSRSFPVNLGPPAPGDPPEPAYRIYIRNDSPLLGQIRERNTFGRAASHQFHPDLFISSK